MNIQCSPSAIFLAAFWVLTFGAAWPTTLCAEDSLRLTLQSPKKALISPGSARLETEEVVKPMNIAGQSVLSILLPSEASGLQLEAHGQSIARWAEQPWPLSEASALSKERMRLSHEQLDQEARLKAVQARIALWQAKPANISNQELSQRESLLAEQLPALVREQAQIKGQIEDLKRRLESLPRLNVFGKRVDIVLAKKITEPVALRYSYVLPVCGWKAVYDFNAQTDGSNEVSVRLLADIWQYSGMDWTNTAITLVTQGSGGREPEPLPDWIIDSRLRTAPRGANQTMLLNADRAAKAVAARDEAGHQNIPAVLADSSGLYASYKLTCPNLPEGKYRLQILADSWKAPLEWLARPGERDSRVWLYARCTLPQDSAWPEGQAQYSVNGESIGQDRFVPNGTVVTLYFGADPRLSLRTNFDGRKQGESGIINTKRTWSWAWTYTLSNAHAKPVKVKVECPMPQITDEGVTVTYRDNPPAEKDEKGHFLFWNVEVPGNGKKTIEHGLSISAPEKLPLRIELPD